MQIAAFSSGLVGLEITKIIASHGCLSHLILDSKNPQGRNDEIRAAASLRDRQVIVTDNRPPHAELAALSSAPPDLIVLAWWSYIVGGELLRIPPRGTLNLHPSLLPYNKGKHYNFWTLVEESPFGVTIHFVDEGIDSGDIAWQKAIEKTWEDTGKTLYERAQAEIINLFREKFALIVNGEIPRLPQLPGEGSFHLGRDLEPASQIDLDGTYSARQLLNLIRARTFPPFPGCRFTANGSTYEARIEIRRVSDAR